MTPMILTSQTSGHSGRTVRGRWLQARWPATPAKTQPAQLPLLSLLLLLLLLLLQPLPEVPWAMWMGAEAGAGESVAAMSGGACCWLTRRFVIVGLRHTHIVTEGRPHRLNTLLPFFVGTGPPHSRVPP